MLHINYYLNKAGEIKKKKKSQGLISFQSSLESNPMKLSPQLFHQLALSCHNQSAFSVLILYDVTTFNRLINFLLENLFHFLAATPLSWFFPLPSTSQALLLVPLHLSDF